METATKEEPITDRLREAFKKNGMISSLQAIKLIENGGSESHRINYDTIYSPNEDLAKLMLLQSVATFKIIGNRWRFLTKRIADTLLQKDPSWLENHPYCFAQSERSAILTMIIEQKPQHAGPWLPALSVMENRTRFATLIVQKGEASIVGSQIKHLSGLNDTVAQGLIKASQGNLVVNMLTRFTQLSIDTIAALMSGHSTQVLESLNDIRGVSHSEIAQLVIKQSGVNSFASNYIQYFTGLEDSIAEQLIDAGLVKELGQNLGCFTNLRASV